MIKLAVYMEDERCNGCGVCCNETKGEPPFNKDEIDGIEDLRIQADVRKLHEERAQRRWDTPCPWLDSETRLCDHYDERPKECREYEIGGDPCVEVRRTHAKGPLPVAPG